MKSNFSPELVTKCHKVKNTKSICIKHAKHGWMCLNAAQEQSSLCKQERSRLWLFIIWSSEMFQIFVLILVFADTHIPLRSLTVVCMWKYNENKSLCSVFERMNLWKLFTVIIYKVLRLNCNSFWTKFSCFLVYLWSLSSFSALKSLKMLEFNFNATIL